MRSCRRRLVRAVTLALSVALAGSAGLGIAGSGIAMAQGPAYAASPPTKGALYSDGNWGRYLLGGEWLYRADPGAVGVAQGFWRNVAASDGWSQVTVPNSFNAGDLSSPSMTGSVGWYRRDFTLPAKAFPSFVARREQHWIVRFESVNYRATVWLNGRRIGTHAGASIPFELNLTNLRSGVNRLVVRVDDRRGPADLPPGPGGGWWNFGGLNREVYLRAVPRDDLSSVLVTPQVPCPTCTATVTATATVRNLTGESQTVSVRARYGSTSVLVGPHVLPPRGTWTARAQIRVPRPRLWSPDHPNLYRAIVTLSDSRGRTLTGYTTESGIRKIAVTANGRLTLNGRVLDLRGVNIHEQDVRLGAALDPAHLRRLVAWARTVGATMIRAHYPLSPLIEELADRQGVLLWNEIPVYQNANTYLGRAGWRKTALTYLRTDVLTNENHPSILAWSIGNELATPPPSAEAGYITAAAGVIHSLDPTRPATIALSNWPGVACQSAYAPLDMLGVNEYIGWFDAGGGSTDDRDVLSPWLDGLRACYPKKALMITEFGFEGNRHGPIEERGTYEFQADNAGFHLGVFASKSWLSGALWFAMQTFAAHPGWGGGDPWPDPPFVQKGTWDQFGQPTPLLPVLSGLYHGTVQIAPATGSRDRSKTGGSL
jgi:beta-glucuronidase